MIWESCFWKQPLLRSATWLERLTVSDGNSERTLASVERNIFIGFYSIRKLLETFKVSEETRNITFDVHWHPNIKCVDYFNAHKIDECYNFSEIHEEKINLISLCNQFIHSYVFVIITNINDSFAGCHICSDRKRQEKLYYVGRDDILRAFRAVGHDYPTQLHLKRNSKTAQWEQAK